MKVAKIETDVLIVGGGLSGLALADRLAQAGQEFLLVEAQSRFGGRVLTTEVAGGAFDLGPSWFWPGQPRMAELASRLGVQVFEQFSSGDLMFQDQNGTVHRGLGYASMAGSLRLAGGMGALVDGLVKNLPSERLLHDARVTHVAEAQGGLSATIANAGAPLQVSARRVVFALPPRVIAKTIEFQPALSDVQMRALLDVPTWMAGQAKILAVYDEAHWRNAGLSGDAMSQSGPMVELHDASPRSGGPYAIFGFVGIPAAQRFGHHEALIAAAKAQLIALFGPEMAAPRDILLQDWAQVPEVATDIDHPPLRAHPQYGLPTALRDLAKSGISFASTETAHGFGGYLEGALEAAERAAEEVLAGVDARAIISAKLSGAQLAHLFAGRTP